MRRRNLFFSLNISALIKFSDFARLTNTVMNLISLYAILFAKRVILFVFLLMKRCPHSRQATERHLSPTPRDNSLSIVLSSIFGVSSQIRLILASLLRRIFLDQYFFPNFGFF